MSSTRSLFSSEKQVLNVSDLLNDVFSGCVEVLVPVSIVPNEMLCSSGGRVNALVIDWSLVNATSGKGCPEFEGVMSTLLERIF
jgi:hypothetical protein